MYMLQNSDLKKSKYLRHKYLEMNTNQKFSELVKEHEFQIKQNVQTMFILILQYFQNMDSNAFYSNLYEEFHVQNNL